MAGLERLFNFLRSFVHYLIPVYILTADVKVVLKLLCFKKRAVDLLGPQTFEASDFSDIIQYPSFRRFCRYGFRRCLLQPICCWNYAITTEINCYNIITSYLVCFKVRFVSFDESVLANTRRITDIVEIKVEFLTSKYLLFLMWSLFSKHLGSRARCQRIT